MGFIQKCDIIELEKYIQSVEVEGDSVFERLLCIFPGSTKAQPTKRQFFDFILANPPYIPSDTAEHTGN